MLIQLCTTDSMPNVIHKKLNVIKTINAPFNHTFTNMNPTLILDAGFTGILDTIRTVTYITIEGYGYFVENVEVQEQGIIRFMLRMDVLYSYKDFIDNCEVMLERSGNAAGSYGPLFDEQYIHDTMRPIADKKTYEVVYFPNELSEDEADGVYILATSQTGYDPLTNV